MCCWRWRISGDRTAPSCVIKIMINSNDPHEAQPPLDFDTLAQVPEHAQGLGCEYSLKGLSRPLCPECGRPFIPSDRSTFRLVNPVPLWHDYAKPPTRR